MPLTQPKKPVGGAYGVFLAQHRAEFTAATKGERASAVTKLAGEKWKKLSEKDRKPYNQKYQDVKAKYDKDMKAFLASGGEKQLGARAKRTLKQKDAEGGGKRRRRRVAKDPNRPRRPAGGAYGVFLSKNRQAFQKECPGSIAGVAKLAGKKWAALTEAQKKPFELEFRELQAAYRAAMKTYVPPQQDEAEEEEGDDREGEEEEEEEEE